MGIFNLKEVKQNFEQIRRAQDLDGEPKKKAKKNKKIKNKRRKQKQMNPIEFHCKNPIIEEYINLLEDYQQKESLDYAW